MDSEIRPSTPTVQSNEPIVKAEIKRDPEAEICQRIAIGFFGALLLFIPYLIPKFRNYVFYGPEIVASIPEVQKADYVAKKSFHKLESQKPPSLERFKQEHHMVAAHVGKKAGLNQPSNAPILKALDKLDPPEDKINAKTCGLNNFLSLLSPGETNYKHAEIIFNCMLNSILPDAFEEVIGQERKRGVLPELINSALEKKQIENTPELKKMAAALYPLALLACYFGKNVKIPSKNIKKLAGNDAHAFVEEYKGQFKNKISDDRADIWTEKFMKECLEKVWALVEEKREKALDDESSDG